MATNRLPKFPTTIDEDRLKNRASSTKLAQEAAASGVQNIVNDGNGPQPQPIATRNGRAVNNRGGQAKPVKQTHGASSAISKNLSAVGALMAAKKIKA